jgi:glycosyltransferase involved in cell wall biosynthesis
VKQLKPKGIGTRICLVSLDAYPLLARKDTGFVGGGAELRLTLLAKEVVKQGFEVSFITYGDGGEPIEYIDNIRVIKIYKRDDTPHLSLPIKAWHIWSALTKANADIYLESPGLPGIVSLFCRLRGRKKILSIASEIYIRKKSVGSGRQFYLSLTNRLNLRLANSIIAQNESQRKMLSENFGKQSIIIKNPFLLSAKEMPSKQHPPLVLWVAEFKPPKQAELFLELAKAIPETKFQMIGGPALGKEQYFTSIQEAARGIPNLEFLGFIPRHRIDYYFAKAGILVNTSVHEGFSNAFLEAWAAYTPVVSLNADPDEIICRHRLGFHSRSFEQMVVDTRTLLDDTELRGEMGKNGRRYVEQEHNIEKIVAQYVTLFQKLASQG